MGIAGRNFYLNLDNSSGTPTDLSTYLNKIDQNDDVGMEASTTAGPSVIGESNTVTLTSGGFTIDAPYHATLDAHLSALKALTTGVTFTFIIGPKGSTAGYPKTTGECRLKSYKRTMDVAGILKCTAEFVYDGTISETTF